MKEPHGKAVANRSNPESCAGGGNIAGEALTSPLQSHSPNSYRPSHHRPRQWLRQKEILHLMLSFVQKLPHRGDPLFLSPRTHGRTSPTRLPFRPGVIAQGNADGRRIEAELLVDPKSRDLASLGRLDDRARIAIQGLGQFFGPDSLADRRMDSLLCHDIILLVFRWFVLLSAHCFASLTFLLTCQAGDRIAAWRADC